MRTQALELLHQYVQSESLRGHCAAVAKAMEGYAKFYGENAEEWWVCGLLHDFDYEQNPTLEHHPFVGAKLLKEKHYPESIITAILGHGNHTGVKRESLMAKTLFAVDELCGLIIALSRVRPDKFDSMTAESVEKAMKKKGFAAGCNRDDIEQGIVELGVDRKEHFERVIAALKA